MKIPMDFKSFPDVKQIGKAAITITQKLHGTNAQIVVYPTHIVPEGTPADGREIPVTYEVKAGSRNRWLTTEDDNFGFAKYVEENKQEIIEKLGEGTWYGEWVGPGINSSEGLKEKVFAIFNIARIEDRPLPPRMVGVPLLYKGSFSSEAIDAAFNDLRENGSKLVPGYKSPEGIVIHLLGTDLRFKKVFKAEETAWKKPDRPKGTPKPAGPDVSHLLQPIRLEKLLSKEERYLVGYPETLPQICKDYTEDLIKEGQIAGTDDEIKVLKKALGGELFPFVKSFMTEKGL
jgi:hypothetical protein